MRSKVIRFYLISIGLFCLFRIEALAQDISYDIRTSTGRYIFSYEEISASLVPVDPGATAISYSWERSPYPLFSHDVVLVNNTATYNISTPLAKTTYFRRKVTLAGSAVVYSNIIKIEIASKYRENFNYVREHEVLVSGKTDWKEVNQLPIGDKLQTTTYIQKGVLPGGTAPVNIDNLSYTYASLSNKLIKVTDNSTAGAANGGMGDFKDGTNSGDDYVYDDNGNLIIDLNKEAKGVSGGVSTPLGTSGITYNFLDKPELIRIAGKGTIQIMYDANGNKLQRKFTPEGGTAKITTYVNEFVYEGDQLSYINFEEGRIRVLTPVSANNGFDGLAIDGNMDLPGGKRGAYDYFVRDYQQNVRMILTEQTHTSLSQCTMESERAVNEEAVFGQSGSGNEVVKTRTAKPPGWAGNASSKVSRLSSSANKAGPNVLLKVMAGDEISTAANYYYQNPVTNSTGNNLTGPIITSLIQSVLGSAATGVVKGNTAGISGQLNANAEFLNKTAPDAGNPVGNNPKAYLTVLFFNERFEFVSEGSTVLRVTQAGDNAPALVIPNIKAPKNGFAYVYLSNESNEAVYFDDFKVAHTRGRIIEENHYYAFGLRIAGISSAKFGEAEYEGSLRNDYLYNDKELWIDADLNWYDYGFRNYDPQIGRFPQLDPLTWDYPHYTPYQYAGNEPIANIDLDGLEEWNVLSGVLNQPTGKLAETVTLQAVVIKGVKTASSAAVSKGSTVGKVLSGALKSAGTGVATFAKGMWNEGVVPTVDWINHNVNPVYGVFNGINSMFTGQDFLSGEPMTRADGIAELGFSLIPGARAGKVGKGIVTGAAKTGVQYTKSSLKLGQEMHKGYKAGLADGVTTFKEFTGIKGIRPDFVDFGTKTIYELKTFNPRQIQLGTKQLNNYKSLFEQKYGGTWKTVLDTY